MSPPAAKLNAVGGGAPGGGSTAGASGTTVRPSAATRTAQYGVSRPQRLMPSHSAPSGLDPPESRERSPTVHRRRAIRFTGLYDLPMGHKGRNRAAAGGGPNPGSCLSALAN